MSAGLGSDSSLKLIVAELPSLIGPLLAKRGGRGDVVDDDGRRVLGEAAVLVDDPARTVNEPLSLNVQLPC